MAFDLFSPRTLARLQFINLETEIIATCCPARFRRKIVAWHGQFVRFTQFALHLLNAPAGESSTVLYEQPCNSLPKGKSVVGVVFYERPRYVP